MPPGSEIVQRAFRKADLLRIVELRRQGIEASFPGRRFDEKRFRERLAKAAGRKTESIEVLEKGGELIGYLWFGIGNGDVGKYGTLRQIFIREDFRGMGLAERLLRHAEAGMAKKGVKRVKLTVTNSNIKALELYEKMKYRKARLVMEKTL